MEHSGIFRSGRSEGGASNLSAGIDKKFLQFRERPLIDGGAGNDREIAMGGEEGLMLAEKFAQAALGAVAQDRVADRRGGRDDANAGQWKRGSALGDGAGSPPEGEGAGVETTALGAHDANVVLAAEMLLRAETHGGPRR